MAKFVRLCIVYTYSGKNKSVLKSVFVGAYEKKVLKWLLLRKKVVSLHPRWQHSAFNRIHLSAKRYFF